ncbi:MAG: hypothetical protein Q4G71_05075 [Pseudomonadota bacterium]|nr:hypothetical protein [Pseudomonadota bacterium]
MGTNVIYLADRVPSYRRARAHRATLPAADLHASAGSAANTSAANGTWARLARERVVAREAARQTPLLHTPAPSSTHAGATSRPTPALRVTRVAEPTAVPGGVGRLRISGRLIDVCAELERLAAAEAA